MFINKFFNTSKTPVGGAASDVAAFPRRNVIGKRKLPHTATTAPINVVTI